jgi:hypothetical protein
MLHATRFGLLPALVGGVAVALVASGALRAEVPPGAGRFVELRVCGATTFSRALGRCSRDERHLGIRSNRFTCSAVLQTREPGVLRARFRLAGVAEPWGVLGRVQAGDTRLVSYSRNIKTDQPLPGGNWACEFAFGGTRAALSFRSGGPRGKIIATAVCPESAVLTFPGRVSALKTCATDHSRGRLSLSESIYCSAVFAGVRGQSAEIEFLRSDGSSVWATRLEITWPTANQAWSYTTVENIGDYRCRFRLEDGTTMTKRFRVGP